MIHRVAPAKINLGLHVLRRRPDGYHDIETVFVRIPWADVLYAGPADGFHFSCTDPDLPVGPENLVVEAAQRLGVRGARIELEKHVPVGAGLGGGSSDAAAALLLLDACGRLGRSRAELLSLASEIGSDVAFFLTGQPTAFGTGRGNELEALVDPVTKQPYVLPWPLVVAVPPERVSTAAAYRLVQPTDGDRVDLRAIACSNDLDRWRAKLVNDFEGPVLERYPTIARTKACLEEAGAAYASLSGSGSAVFGVFEGDALAEEAAERLRSAGHRVWCGRGG